MDNSDIAEQVKALALHPEAAATVQSAFGTLEGQLLLLTHALASIATQAIKGEPVARETYVAAKYAENIQGFAQRLTESLKPPTADAAGDTKH